jgi:hypothetical protein
MDGDSINRFRKKSSRAQMFNADRHPRRVSGVDRRAMTAGTVAEQPIPLGGQSEEAG